MYEISFRWIKTTKRYERFEAVNPPQGVIVGDIYKPLGDKTAPKVAVALNG
jgi:hypothetical protein